MAEQANKTLADIVTSTQTASEPFPGILNPANPAASRSSSSLPSGMLADYAGSAAPDGWLLCDGSAVSRTLYSDLFAAISTSYGAGNGSTTFNLPDTQGRATIGKGSHADVSALGNSDGLSAAKRRPTHNHTVVLTANTISSSGAPYIQFFGNTAAGGTTALNPTVGPQTGNEPTDTVAYVVVNKIIKT